MTALLLQNELGLLANPGVASFVQGFFKTGPGQYGEGDIFRGIRVPVLRKLSKKYQDLPLSEVEQLLRSAFHEDRLTSLLILVRRFSRDETSRSGIYRLYLKNRKRVNNWDLVDSSAGHIVGGFLWERDRDPIYRLANSRNLWERRIAVISTSYFIGKGDFRDTLRIAEMLIEDREDLIHKAVGWMLREVGKRDLKIEETFLRCHHARMPRTMLRYAIEKFPEASRQQYLAGKVRSPETP